MKQAYFTTENIAAKSHGFLQTLEIEVPVRFDHHQVSNYALLVLDMQDFFLNSNSHAFIPSGGAIIPGINRLVTSFRQYDWPIIFTQHTNTTSDASAMENWWGNLITADNPLSRITPLITSDSDKIITKTQYDAFFNTELETLLHSLKSRNLIVCGVMTHLCCETTARSAFVRGINVIFPIDGTATYNEQFHLGTLRNLAHGFAVIPTINQIIKMVRIPQ